jgi:anti-sigma regulatory factor (Ser/Thr protein kinase)
MWELGSDLSAIGEGRRLAAVAVQVGTAQSAAKIDVDAVTLVVSELLTNAFLHGAPPVALEIDTDAGLWVRVMISDASPTPPRPPPEQVTELLIGGRGLAIVEAVSSRWGWLPTPEGKQVWCELVPNA